MMGRDWREKEREEGRDKASVGRKEREREPGLFRKQTAASPTFRDIPKNALARSALSNFPSCQKSACNWGLFPAACTLSTDRSLPSIISPPTRDLAFSHSPASTPTVL